MRRTLAGAAVLAATAALLVAAPALAVTERTSFIAIEQQVMCVTCGIPLAEADSVAAQQEKAYIQRLVNAGETAAKIKSQLVTEFGASVLALPPDSGFNVAFYLVPIAAVLAALATVALLLPRWRRNRRAAVGAAARGADPDGDADPLSAADSARLDEDLARFDPR
jgi:cytochrome c-type biogenesis protein CcmH/NrfF